MTAVLTALCRRCTMSTFTVVSTFTLVVFTKSNLLGCNLTQSLSLIVGQFARLKEKDGLFYEQLYKISFYSYIFFFIYFLRFKKYVAISSLDRFNAVQAHPVVFLWKEKKNSNRYGRFCNFIPNILIIITYRDSQKVIVKSQY